MPTLSAPRGLGPVWEAPDAWEPDEEEIAAAEGGPDDPLTQR